MSTVSFDLLVTYMVRNSSLIDGDHLSIGDAL